MTQEERNELRKQETETMLKEQRKLITLFNILSVALIHCKNIDELDKNLNEEERIILHDFGVILHFQYGEPIFNWELMNELFKNDYYVFKNIKSHMHADVIDQLEKKLKGE